MGNLRTRVPIGAHKALWIPDGGTVIELGFTKEGCTLEVETSSYDRKIDEAAMLYDKRVDAVSIKGEIELVEVDLDTVATCLGMLKTTVAGSPAKVSIDMNPMRGAVMPFGRLTFHPRNLFSTNYSMDKTIWNAIVDMSGGRIFKAAEDGSMRFGFEAGLYWDSTLSKYKFYTEGDPATDVGFDL